MEPDLSTQLNLPFWQEWYFEVANSVPIAKDSWHVHSADTLDMYCMGNEL